MNNIFDMLDSLQNMMSPNPFASNKYTPLGDKYIDAIEKLAISFKKNVYLGGPCYSADFNNGYGISIIKNNGSYGREDDLWEIAVMKDGKCCYDTPITDDVIGWLDADEVVEYAKKIAEL
jgi:hypothetical protein